MPILEELEDDKREVEDPLFDYFAIKNYSVEKFKKDGKHFSHGHPLKRWCQDKEEEVDKKSCRICGVPLVCSPSYTCTIGCKFFLHQECALKLPPKLFHPSHSLPNFYEESHILFIRQESPNCTYECEDCDIRIHPLVAVPTVEIKTQHKSHQSHPLIVFCKELSCECDACGKKQDGFFFTCSQGCNFWIHSACAVLPNAIVIPDRPQPFILTYSLPPHQLDRRCLICKKRWVFRHNGVYFCPRSSNYSHVACAIAGEETRLELMQLPDDESDTFPILTIRRYENSTPSGRGCFDDSDDEEEEEEEELRIEKYHNHPLTLTIDDIDRKALNCDLCTKPINVSSPFYRCSLDLHTTHCPFAAHKICADILPFLNFGVPIGPGEFIFKLCRDPSSLFFNSVFHCIFCHRPCNGLCFTLPRRKILGDIPFVIDLECMAAPSTINHASHPHHLLFRTHRMTLTHGISLTCCPNGTFLHDVYKCSVCEYYIHISCAVLPKMLRYDSYHHHPLHLVFTRSNSNSNGYGLCEVCEGKIDLNYWLYGCIECEQWFHMKCIPSVGYLSKVKLGGTLSLPELHGDHPVALTRMLTLPSQRCGRCRRIIRGLVDELAFCCSDCHFWIHFSCARDSAANPIRIYSDVNDQRICRKFQQKVLGDSDE